MLKAAGLFGFVILLVASLAWLTLAPEQDCREVDASRSTDMGAAVLADDEGDQSALTNRAMIERRDCEPAAQP